MLERRINMKVGKEREKSNQRSQVEWKMKVGKEGESMN